MSLTLHFHPLASYCHKALIAPYEVLPFEGYANLAACFGRLKGRPAYARVLKEAEPYFAMFPRED